MFQIALNAAEFAPGSIVTGTATFVAEKAVTPKRISLDLLWSTRGRGDVSYAYLAEGNYEPGPVAAGETVRVPFEAALPEHAPRSFAGELIELYYCVRGRVDLPWAIDEKAEAEFAVVNAA